MSGVTRNVAALVNTIVDLMKTADDSPHSLQGDHDVSLTIANISLQNTKRITNYVGVEISFRRKNVRLMYRYISLSMVLVTTSSFAIILPESIGNLKLVIPVTILLATVNIYISEMVRKYIIQDH